MVCAFAALALKSRTTVSASRKFTRLYVVASTSSGFRRPLYFVYVARTSAVSAAYAAPNSRAAQSRVYSLMFSLVHLPVSHARSRKYSVGSSYPLKWPTLTIHTRSAPYCLARLIWSQIFAIGLVFTH